MSEYQRYRCGHCKNSGPCFCEYELVFQLPDGCLAGSDEPGYWEPVGDPFEQ